jgi:hypothetical protein
LPIAPSQRGADTPKICKTTVALRLDPNRSR